MTRLAVCKLLSIGDSTIAMSSLVIDSNANRLLHPRPQETLLCDMDLSLSRTLFPLGFGVVILTNRQEVLTAAEASFGHSTLRHGNAHLEVRVGVSESNDKRTPPPPVRREYNHLYSMVA